MIQDLYKFLRTIQSEVLDNVALTINYIPTVNHLRITAEAPSKAEPVSVEIAAMQIEDGDIASIEEYDIQQQLIYMLKKQ